MVEVTLIQVFLKPVVALRPSRYAMIGGSALVCAEPALDNHRAETDGGRKGLIETDLLGSA